MLSHAKIVICLKEPCVEYSNKKLLLFFLAIFSISKPLDIVASPLNSKAKQKKESKLKAKANKLKTGAKEWYNSNKEKLNKRIKNQSRPEGSLESTDLKVLNENKNYHKNNKDYHFTLKWIDRIIAVSSDAEEIQAVRLEQADLNYLVGNYEKAGSGYKEYVKLYPGSSEAEYAKYRRIASNFYRFNSPDRDQTLTVDTTLLAKEYLKNKNYKKYAKEVNEILEHGLKNLLDAEIEVFETNLKFKNYEGAQRRLDYIKSKYLPEMPKIKTIVEDLESSLELSKKRGKYVQAYKKERKPILEKWRKKEFKKQF